MTALASTHGKSFETLTFPRHSSDSHKKQKGKKAEIQR